MIERVRGIVDAAESMEGLRDAPLSAYGDLPADDLAEIMASAFAAADLAGRFDVDAESS